MRLDLVILHLLTCVLKLRQYAFLLIPELTQILPSCLKFREFALYLIHLQRHSFTLYRLTLNLQLTYAAVKFSDRFRHRIHLKTELRSRLIHKVNGLIGKESAGNIAVREFYRCNEGIVLDTHLMVVLISLLETSHYGYGSSRRRFLDHHHLKTSLQGLVCLEIFLILVKSG